MQLSKYFSTENDPKIKCPCCKQLKISPLLLETLDATREGAGEAVEIESGYRCPAHNATLKGSVPNSGHTTGEAADIYIKGWNNTRLYDLIKTLHAAGNLPYLTYCYRIKGQTNTGVHIGTDKKPRKKIFG